MTRNQVVIVAFNQQRFLNRGLTHWYTRLRYIMLILTGLMWSPAHAADYDQKYRTWKQQHAASPSHAQDHHYFGKPTLKAVAAKISINTANLEQLQQLHGVGAKKAQAILDYRQKNGRFKSIDELQNVKGFGAQLLSKNREQLSL